MEFDMYCIFFVIGFLYMFIFKWQGRDKQFRGFVKVEDFKVGRNRGNCYQ